MLDTVAVGRLVADTGDESFVLGLLQSYRSQLRRRVERVSTAGDLAEGMDAVLSLRTSSQMVGAVEVAGLARGVEDELRRGDLGGAERARPALDAAVHRCELAIGEHLADRCPVVGWPSTA